MAESASLSFLSGIWADDYHNRIEKIVGRYSRGWVRALITAMTAPKQTARAAPQIVRWDGYGNARREWGGVPDERNKRGGQQHANAAKFCAKTGPDAACVAVSAENKPL